MKRIILIIIIAFCYNSNALSDDAANNDPLTLMLKVRVDPHAVLKELESYPQSTRSHQLSAKIALVKAHSQLALVYPKEALAITEKALSSYTEKPKNNLYYRLVLARALALDYMGKIEQGLTSIEEVLEWGSNNSDSLKVEALYVKGVLQTSQGNYIEAYKSLLNAYEQAAPSTNAKSDSMTKGDIAGSLGLVFENRGELVLTKQYYEEAVAYHRLNQFQLELSIVLYGLGRANISIGHEKEGEEQLLEALAISNQLGDEQGVAFALAALAEYRFDKADYKETIDYIKQAIPIFEKSNNKAMMFGLYLRMGKVALKQNAVDEALGYADKASGLIDRAKPSRQSFDLIRFRSRIYAEKKEFGIAYQLISESIEQQKALMQAQSLSELKALKDSFEEKQIEKEREVQRLKLSSSEAEQQKLWMLITFLSIMIAGLIYGLFRRNKYQHKLEQLARIDDLTQVYNRRQIYRLLEKQCLLAQRNNQSFAIAILDLDYFKNINDQFGHAVGDIVLKGFAKLCKERLRKTDLIGRVGGEEFLLILPDTEQQGAEKTLKSLLEYCAQLASQLQVEELVQEKVRISFSAGLGVVTPKIAKENQLKSWISELDKGLYIAKEKGRNRFEPVSL